MLPDPDTSVQYHIQFADDNYEIANHAMPFTELLAALDGAAVNLATAATKALFPGLYSIFISSPINIVYGAK